MFEQLSRRLVVPVVVVTALLAVPAGAAPRSSEPLVQTSALQQLAMATPSSGYGLFTSWGGRLCQDVVGQTSNGGATFSHFHLVQRWACNGYYPDESLILIGPGDLLLYGHGFFASYDQGSSWIAVPHQGHVLQVVQQGWSIWLVEALCRTPAPLTCPLRVATSTDDGRDWRLTPRQPQGAVGPSTSEAPATGETYLVRSGTTAYVLSHGSERYASVETSPMWVTNDGGATWERRDVRCAAGVGSLVMSAAPDGTLIAVCGSGLSAGSESKSTSVSVDEGAIWFVVASCNNDPRARQLCQGYLGSVVAVSSRNAYVIGWRSPLHVTESGGAWWTNVLGVGNTNGGPAQVYFFDALHGFAVGELGAKVAIWHTSDRGRHWAVVIPRIASG